MHISIFELLMHEICRRQLYPAQITIRIEGHLMIILAVGGELSSKLGNNARVWIFAKR